MFSDVDKLLIRPQEPVYEAYEVSLKYPAWDELHEVLPRKYFYGGCFFDGHGNIVDIIEECDMLIKHSEGVWSLIKHQDYLKNYEVVK